jgi:hypothetical protein
MRFGSIIIIVPFMHCMKKQTIKLLNNILHLLKKVFSAYI